MLRNIAAWMFSLDNVHYVKWLPVFIQNLKDLHAEHYDVYKEFSKGKFTVRKSSRKCSCISDDQVHEQNNKLIKFDGDTVGILHNVESLLKWMFSGSEISRMVNMTQECEAGADKFLHYHENQGS